MAISGAVIAISALIVIALAKYEKARGSVKKEILVAREEISAVQQYIRTEISATKEGHHEH